MSNIFELAAKITLDSSQFESGIQKSQTSMQKLAGTAKKVGNVVKTGMLAAGTAITALGTYSIKAGMDFEAQMSKVGAISGATGENLEALTDKAKQLGRDTKFSATEAGEAFEYMAMAGWKTNDMLEGVTGVMDLAAASGESLASVSDIVTDAMTAFGLEANQAGHFADVLAQASSNSNTNVGMMGETFKYVAPIAGALGYKIEDTALAIGLMANAGIKSSQAGTSLRGSLTRLTKPTKEVQEALVALGLAGMKTVTSTGNVSKAQEKLAKANNSAEKALNRYNEALAKHGAESATTKNALISLEEAQSKVAAAQNGLVASQQVTTRQVYSYNAAITDSNGNMLTLKETLDKIREAFKGLTEAEKAQYAAQLFGQEAMSGMLAIINASEEDYDKLTGAINNADGAAKGMAQTMQNNLKGKITILKSSLEGLGLAIYDHLKEPLTNAVQIGIELVGKLTQWIEENGEQVIERTVEIFERTKEILEALSPVIMGVVAAFVAYKTAIGISSIVTAFQKATEGVTIAQAALNAVMNANPFVLVATLIAGVVVALITLWHTNENFRDAVMEIWETIKTNALETWEFISTLFTETIPKAWNLFLEDIKNAWTNITKWFKEKWEAVKKWVLETWENIKKWVLETWEKVTKWFKEKWDEFVKKFKDAWNKLVQWWFEQWEALKQKIMQFVQKFVEVGRELVNKIKEGVANAWAAFTGWFDGLWSSFASKNRSMDVNVNIHENVTRTSSSGGYKGLPGSIDGSHANGLAYVPFDNYVAQLHKGERVLTAEENKLYNQGNAGITIIQNIQTVPQTAAEFAAVTESMFEEARWAF